MQYSNFKDTLQNIASQIGNVEQEVEEHKYVSLPRTFHITFLSLQVLLPNTCDLVLSPRDMGNQLRMDKTNAVTLCLLNNKSTVILA